MHALQRTLCAQNAINSKFKSFLKVDLEDKISVLNNKWQTQQTQEIESNNEEQ